MLKYLVKIMVWCLLGTIGITLSMTLFNAGLGFMSSTAFTGVFTVGLLFVICGVFGLFMTSVFTVQRFIETSKAYIANKNISEEPPVEEVTTTEEVVKEG